MTLNEKQKAFCEQYILDYNGTQAAIRAGYAPRSAYNMANLNLNKTEIQQYIKSLNEQTRLRNNITKDSIIEDIVEIRDRCMQRVPVMIFNYETKELEQKIDYETGEGVWQFDANNALKACDMLAKHVGFYEADKGPNTNTNINILATPQIGDLVKIKKMLDEA